MSILSIGLERGEKIGLEKGLNQGKAQSILELLEESGPVTMKTRKMILDETDAERLSVWLKAAARAGSEADFLSKIMLIRRMAVYKKKNSTKIKYLGKFFPNSLL